VFGGGGGFEGVAEKFSGKTKGKSKRSYII